MTREKLMLYFNTDIETEKKMWDYINKDGKNRKSYTVKKLLEKAIENEPVSVAPVSRDIVSSDDDLDDFDENDLL